MKCPHCEVAFRATSSTVYFTGDGSQTDLVSARFALEVTVCPECSKPTIELITAKSAGVPIVLSGHQVRAYPTTHAKRSAASEVPHAIARDFEEAAAVIHLSPQASAALSRRCLQHVLREGGYKHNDLSKAIEAALASGLPSWLSGGLDAVRNIGNFAAHPTKDQNSGAIVPVETAEAEWNLDVLEQLFDFYYVQPAVAQQRQDALNAKLQAAGKKPMKMPAAAGPDS